MSDVVVAGVKRCPSGHPMTPDNVYVPPGRTTPRCRRCARDAKRRHERKLKTKREANLDDLDLAILSILPNEGAKLGKYLDDTRTSNQLAKLLDDPYVTPGKVGRRLSELLKRGYVIPASRSAHKSHSGMGWQRTRSGIEALDEGGA